MRLVTLTRYCCASASVSLCVSVAMLATSASLQAQGIAHFGIPMKARDGVTLVSDIWMPADTGRWPTVLIRTPYQKTFFNNNIGIGAAAAVSVLALVAALIVMRIWALRRFDEEAT